MLKHVISASDFDPDTLIRLLSFSQKFLDCRFVLPDPKILATLFFEPSTRTRLSFESAMLQIGGRCLGFSDDKTSSTSKGESLQDTIRTIEGYADIIVMRHPLDGAARLATAAVKSSIPIINGGDGSNSHVTQALTDLFTIRTEIGRLNKLKIGYMGDLKYGRTVHSLVHTMSMFENNVHYFIPPDSSLDIEEDHIPANIRFMRVNNLQDIIEELDVLYVTRLQKERFPDPLEFDRIIRNYKITPESLRRAKNTLIVLHPLPRNQELSVEVDDLPYAKYFKQAHNGVVVRKAILWKLLTEGSL